MATFYQTCIYLCLGLLAFNLLFSVVDAVGGFSTTAGDAGVVVSESNVLSKITGLDDPSINGFWVLAVGTSIGLSVGLAWLTHSITPVGIDLFGTVFWTAYIRTISVVNYGGFIPAEVIAVFSVLTVLVFIAAVIGMLTGSG